MIKQNVLNKLDSELNKLRSQEARERKNIDVITQSLWVILAGTLGSVVSILIRIDEFHNKPYRDPLTPFLLGALKPFIGASFAIFFYALLSSELVIILPVESNANQPRTSVNQPSTSNEINSKKTFFIFAVAFIVGFSERLAKDTINRMEGTLGAEQKNSQSTEISTSNTVIAGPSKVSQESVFIKQDSSDSEKSSQT